MGTAEQSTKKHETPTPVEQRFSRCGIFFLWISRVSLTYLSYNDYFEGKKKPQQNVAHFLSLGLLI